MDVDLTSLSDDELLDHAAQIANETDGRQWALGAIGIEAKERATRGAFDVARCATAAGRAIKTLYLYAQAVAIYNEAGMSTWVDFRARFPICGFTAARDVALRFKDATAAVSFLEERAARQDIDECARWRVENVRASLAGVFNPDAPRKVLEIEGDRDALVAALRDLPVNGRYTMRVYSAAQEAVAA